MAMDVSSPHRRRRTRREQNWPIGASATAMRSSAPRMQNRRYGPVVGQVWQRGLVRIVMWWQERSLGWTAAALACGVGSITVTSDERWLAANWPFVRGSLPA